MSPVRRLVRPMRPRDPNEAHRTSTVLELFFDLVYVVAVGTLVTEWHHAIGEGHLSSLLSYVMVFMALWWAWMNFTWFANFFDVDDVPYRLLVLLIMLGSLALSAGIPTAFEHGDFRVMTAAYVVMRVAVVALWIRAARANPAMRRYALRWAYGIMLCQVYWVVFAFSLPPESLRVPGFFLGFVAEILVPLWAHGPTPAEERPDAHPEHIEERYGLFTIIVLGEMVTLCSNAFSDALDDHARIGPLIVGGVAAAVLAFALWWLYFDCVGEYDLADVRTSFVWGYGHYFVFASLGAVGAALAALFDAIAGKNEPEHALADWALALTLAAPVALFILVVALLDLMSNGVMRTRWYAASAAVLVIGTWAGAADPVLAIVAVATTTAAFLALELWLKARKAAAVVDAAV